MEELSDKNVWISKTLKSEILQRVGEE
ncbi:MAG: hypothetical protein ACOCXH_03760 [Cyclobacteriaceae bacterium]